MDVEMFHVRSERLLLNTPTTVGGASVEVFGDVLLSLGGCDTQSFAGYDLIQYAFLPSAVDSAQLTASECRCIEQGDAYDVCFTLDVYLATGPSDRWFAVGLGSTAMHKMYALVGFNDSVLMERRPGPFLSGTRLQS